MADSSPHLPDYREPPIDEVAIAAQFPSIPNLTDSHIRDFWKSVRDEYPIAENQPRLEGPIESYSSAQALTFQLPAPGGIPLPMRMWMISDADDFLLQVQNTRFIQNWRRRQGAYPRFEELRDRFWKNYNQFRSFLDTQDISAPIVQQVEVTYLNWIPEIPMVEYLLPAASTGLTIDGTTHLPEDQSWSARYLLGNTDGTIERLYVQCLPAVRPISPDVRGSQLGLVFRAAREGGLTDEQMEFLINSGHVMIVETFAQVTTASAQQTWGRYQ
jgi:uncharacterized protein (TIGR04255 family)